MDFQTIIQLLLATFLGGLIGLERQLKQKEAGLQTYGLVSLGSCLFTIIALFLLENRLIIDLSSIFLAAALGIGFIGAGTIFHWEGKTEGLTTAAGLWVTTTIGLTVGLKLYSLSLFITFLVLLIFAGLGSLEENIFKKKFRE
jgi:putative Mg2+ transporter-C (MgtC) family protein